MHTQAQTQFIAKEALSVTGGKKVVTPVVQRIVSALTKQQHVCIHQNAKQLVCQRDGLDDLI